MGRRGLLSLIAGALAWAGLHPALAQEVEDAFEAPFDPARLPFPAVRVAGRDALERWEAIKAEGEAWPVVLGDALACSHLLEMLSYEARPIAELIAAADGVVFPRDLLAAKAAEHQAFLDDLRKAPPGDIAFEERDLTASGLSAPRGVTNAELLKTYEAEDEMGVEVGDWPARPDVYPPLGSIIDYRTGLPQEEIYIALLPTTDGTATPAWLKFGGWNDCPPVEHQIAALRSLRDRYGAQVVACTHDTLDLRVARRPASREEALALARELYAYCGDSIDQGHETLSRFAAALMVSDWWTFWWD